MVRMIQRRLIIPRGDTGSFSIPYLKTINPGDVAVFTIFDIRTKTKMYQKLIAAEGDILNIAFTHGDTVNLKPGKYLWDIKIYTNPQIIDDELVNGDEVDSYYAGFSLPECEIRETGDTLLTSDDAPTSTISPESLNIINAAINETLNNKRVAVEAAETASSKADAATESAKNASNSAFAASQSAALAEIRVNEIENLSVEVDTGLEGTDASVTYTPFTGVLSFIIPRGNTGNGIASCVLNDDFTLTINYTNGDSTTTIPIRGDTPHLTIGEVIEGPNAIATITGTDANPILNLTLPNANVPTKLSQLIDNIGIAKSADLAAVATSGSYTDLEDKPYIPVKTSDLTDDSNYAVDSNYVHTDNNYTTTEKEKLSGIAVGAEVNVNADWNATSGDAYILNKPTKVSDFTNDVGYLTTETDPTVPAWAKAAQKPSYTAAEVGAPTVAEMNTAIGTAIGNINSFDMTVVQELPTQDISTHTIYLVPKTGETNDVYDEYVYINSKWEMVGNTQIDLSGYALKSELPTKVSELSNDSGYLTSYTETDPTVPQWAKASTKPSYTAAEVGALSSDTHIPSTTAELTNDAGFITANDVVEAPVQDVQVNGTSVINENKIADIQINSDINKASVILNATSGAIASIPDAAAAPVDALTVGIEPVQDLHGYDHPWPAGGGNNLIDDSKRYVAADTTVYIGAESSAYIAALPAGTYTISVDFGGELYGMYYREANDTNNRTIWSSGDGVTKRTFTIDEDGVFRFWVYRNATGGGVDPAKIIHVQIEKGSTATAYSPYSNICPITGWTRAKVTRTGKNLLQTPYYDGSKTEYGVTFTVNNDGSVSLSGTNNRGSTIYYGFVNRNFPKKLKKGSYSVGRTGIAGATFSIVSRNADNTQVNALAYANETDKVFTLSEDTLYYSYLSINAGVTVNATFYPRLELGSTATSYEPYSGQTYDITFPTEAGTVYGGTLDVTNGVLTVDRAMVDMGTLTWRYETQTSLVRPRFAASLMDGAPKSPYWVNNALTSIYKCGSSVGQHDVDFEFGIATASSSGNSTIYVTDSRYTDATTFKAAMSGVQLVYELAHPITYTLTPAEIRTLLGTNNIWADTGDVTVGYKADTKMYIDKKFAELQALILEH